MGGYMHPDGTAYYSPEGRKVMVHCLCTGLPVPPEPEEVHHVRALCSRCQHPGPEEVRPRDWVHDAGHRPVGMAVQCPAPDYRTGEVCGLVPLSHCWDCPYVGAIDTTQDPPAVVCLWEQEEEVDD